MGNDRAILLVPAAVASRPTRDPGAWDTVAEWNYGWKPRRR